MNSAMDYRNFNSFLDEIEETHRTRVAYRWLTPTRDEMSRTYEEFCGDVRRVASVIHERIGEGKHVAILGGTSYYWMSTYFGIILSSNVAVLMDPKLNAEAVAERIAFADVSVLFVSEALASFAEEIKGECGGLEDVIIMEDLYKDAENGNPNFLMSLDPDALSQIIFTSGTTGIGKGVMLSQKNALAVTYGESSLCNPGERLLSVLPCHHCFELFYTHLSHLRKGVEICINDKAENMLENMERFHPNLVVVVPKLADMLSSIIHKYEGEEDRESLAKRFGGKLRLVGIGGAAPSGEAMKTLGKIGVRCYTGYGLSEAAGGCVINLLASERPDSCGRPFVEGLEASIINHELCLKGPNIMTGYYKMPEETAAVLVDGVLHTGDYASRDANGFIYIKGRISSLIVNSNGENVVPEEIEDLLTEKIQEIREALVFAYEDRLVAAVRVEDDTQNTHSLVLGRIDELNEKLPSYKYISQVRFTTKAFPRTASLKIIRRDAEKMIIDEMEGERKADHRDGGDSGLTGDDVLDVVLAAVRSVLQKADYRKDDNFFHYGGDSLHAAILAQELSDQSFNVRPTDIYRHPTPLALAQYIKSQEKYTHEDDKLPNINEMIIKKDRFAYDVFKKGNRELGTVFITGAGGFLGSHLLYELVKEKESVMCLVRDRKTFFEKMQYYFPGVDLSLVKVFEGDVTMENLGLNPEEYRFCANQTKTVIHCAADVRHFTDEDRQRVVNVHGTENIIKFSKDSNAVLCHVSSYAVAGFNTNEALTEFSLDIGQYISANSYVRSKFNAEQLVLLARREGVDARIFRVGNLSERQRDGRFQINAGDNGVFSLLNIFSKERIYPRRMADIEYDLSPVDETAHALLLLARQAEKNAIWHLVNPNRIALHDIIWGRAVEDDEIERLIVTHPNEHDYMMLRLYFDEERKHRLNRNIDMDFTVRSLERLGFKWSLPNVVSLHKRQETA